jgi:hypothetical protein
MALKRGVKPERTRWGNATQFNSIQCMLQMLGHRADGTLTETRPRENKTMSLAKIPVNQECDLLLSDHLACTQCDT